MVCLSLWPPGLFSGSRNTAIHSKLLHKKYEGRSPGLATAPTSLALPVGSPPFLAERVIHGRLCGPAQSNCHFSLLLEAFQMLNICEVFWGFQEAIFALNDGKCSLLVMCHMLFCCLLDCLQGSMIRLLWHNQVIQNGVGWRVQCWDRMVSCRRRCKRKPLALWLKMSYK